MERSVCFCRAGLAAELPAGAAAGREGEGPWDLCALSPEEAERLADRAIRCRTLLVPEGAWGRRWQAEQVVSYGLDRRSSLTLSSMDGQGVLCVQRALTDGRGRRVEEQELPLPTRWRDRPAGEKLLLSGVWLLLGGLPEDG